MYVLIFLTNVAVSPLLQMMARIIAEEKGREFGFA